MFQLVLHFVSIARLSGIAARIAVYQGISMSPNNAMVIMIIFYVQSTRIDSKSWELSEIKSNLHRSQTIIIQDNASYTLTVT